MIELPAAKTGRLGGRSESRRNESQQVPPADGNNAISRLAIAVCMLMIPSLCRADEYHETVKPILEKHCYDCHADGSKEGGISLDDSKLEEILADKDKWWRVLRNVRAGIMPPSDFDRPTNDEKKLLSDWVKTRVFKIEPNDPDPGQVTIRRLNRVEYRNTIRDLMGVDFNAELVFPPDDTGFGFDNNGDVLTLSPLLTEKFIASAKQIVDEAVPRVTKQIARQEFDGKDFSDPETKDDGVRVSFKEPATLIREITLPKEGEFRINIELEIDGTFEYSALKCDLVFLIDGTEKLREKHKWDEDKTFRYSLNEKLSDGNHQLEFQLIPIELTEEEAAESDRNGNVRLTIESVVIEGPTDKNEWINPPGYDRFFHLQELPGDADKLKSYARDVISNFSTKAFRRPADERTLDRLTQFAAATYSQPDKTFEDGIAQTFVAILASPRFLFRMEEPKPNSNERFPLIDEYALASRLSYLLWSSMPDKRLFELAKEGRLRASLDDELTRMLKDDRSNAFINNFVGQWLRTRDIEKVSIDTLAITGNLEEYTRLRMERRNWRKRTDITDDQMKELNERYDELRKIRDVFDKKLRRAMRNETELMFEHIVRDDRSLLELIDSDYTFANEKLGDFYNLPNIDGEEMRKVSLPPASPRGGVLTQASFLAVTSNPTRTSPVKRGLFILDNILGMPAPPAPPDVPEIEEAAKKLSDREPSFREILALHREAELCSSCHSRMDPLGLSLENFDALGSWRDKENGSKIDASGMLITGQSFQDIRDLKKILLTQHRKDFYRCVTEKLLTYALGRGLDHMDELTIDRIADKLDEHNGRFGALLREVILSPQFQRMR